jgi:hypothetical protein
MKALQTQLPKIAACKDCGKKPKEQVWARGYTIKDDELYLHHWCNAKNNKVYFPEFKSHPFTAQYVNGQRPLVRAAWNKNQEVTK